MDATALEISDCWDSVQECFIANPMPPVFCVGSRLVVRALSMLPSNASSPVVGIKEIPHNTAAHLAVPFPTSAACRFLDLP